MPERRTAATGDGTGRLCRAARTWWWGGQRGGRPARSRCKGRPELYARSRHLIHPSVQIHQPSDVLPPPPDGPFSFSSNLLCYTLPCPPTGAAPAHSTSSVRHAQLHASLRPPLVSRRFNPSPFPSPHSSVALRVVRNARPLPAAPQLLRRGDRPWPLPHWRGASPHSSISFVLELPTLSHTPTFCPQFVLPPRALRFPGCHSLPTSF